MPPQRRLLIGQQFGRWNVLADGGTISGYHPASLCRCDCGVIRRVRNSNLIDGASQSCGCWHVDETVQRLLRHGHAVNKRATRAYACWRHMNARCNNPDHPSFDNYGGRDDSTIRVCPEWRESFQAFLDDMGEPPRGLSIHRVNNAGNYEPGNCIWANYTVQNRNKRTNVIYTIRGITGCITELCEVFGKNKGTVISRLRRGWLPERAFTAPRLKNQYA